MNYIKDCVTNFNLNVYPIVAPGYLEFQINNTTFQNAFEEFKAKLCPKVEKVFASLLDIELLRSSQNKFYIYTTLTVVSIGFCYNKIDELYDDLTSSSQKPWYKRTSAITYFACMYILLFVQKKAIDHYRHLDTVNTIVLATIYDHMKKKV